MSSRSNITIPKYVRQQVNELISSGVVTTLASAVNLGLLLLIRKHKFQRWDDEVFREYEAGMLNKDGKSGVLMSRQFQKDLSDLVGEEKEIRRRVGLTLKRLVNYFDSTKQSNVFPDKSLKIKQLDLKDYYFFDFEFNKKCWRILLRHHKKELIVCRLVRADDGI